MSPLERARLRLVAARRTADWAQRPDAPLEALASRSARDELWKLERAVRIIEGVEEIRIYLGQIERKAVACRPARPQDEAQDIIALLKEMTR